MASASKKTKVRRKLRLLKLGAKRKRALMRKGTTASVLPLGGATEE